jgi:ABC-type glycerol-3-phosphate transport system substrate-binding protein
MKSETGTLSMIRLLSFLIAISFCSQATAQTIEELYSKAAKERVVNFYGTLAQVNAEKILPVFEKRYPGIKINHVDITSDNLVARAVAEARGGKTLGDVFQAPLETAVQMNDQKLLLEISRRNIRPIRRS